MAFQNDDINRYIVDYVAVNNPKYYKRVVIACMQDIGKRIIAETGKPIIITKESEILDDENNSIWK